MSLEAASTPDEPAQPWIVEIKGNSLDDGPGIRSVIFFKGCPLDCLWCHNPETRSIKPQLAFDAAACLATGSCAAQCPQQAISLSPVQVDFGACDNCFACVPACPSGALSVVGESMDPADVIARLQRYKPFYQSSGGGVTLSGGEPTMFPEFCGAVARAAQQQGMHVLLQTCGQFSLQRYLDNIEPHIDQVYFDLKLFDSQAHKEACGVSNARILDNYRAMRHRADNGGPALLARIPLIPDLTACSQNLRALAGFLHATGTTQVSLLDYNPLWTEKSAKIGDTATDLPTTWMSETALQRCRDIFQGIEIV